MTTNVFIHSLENSMLKVTAGNSVTLSQLNKYPERALLLAKRNDFIILEHIPDKNYLNYLIKIGIGTRNILIPNANGNSLSEKVRNDKKLLKFLQSLNGVVLHPYMSTKAEQQIAKLIHATVNGSVPNFTFKVNNKLFLLSFIEKIGLKLPEYEIANIQNVVEIAKQFQKKYSNIIIIGEHSYAGLAVWAIKTPKDFENFQTIIKNCQTQTRFIIEKLYEVAYSPNIQYQINASTIKLLGITDQILDANLEHHGNRYPSLATQIKKIKINANQIANELRKKGYRGLLGIDFIETIDGKIFAVDINGRVNASTFGLKINNQQKHFITLTHLNITQKVNFNKLKQIIGKNNLFDRQTGTGILPYNIGFLELGHFSAIIIGNTEKECQQYLAYIKNDIRGVAK
jgi:hypothetical protein